MQTQKAKKVNPVAAVATLLCGALAIGFHAAGMPWMGAAWSGAAFVWSLSL